MSETRVSQSHIEMTAGKGFAIYLFCLIGIIALFTLSNLRKMPVIIPFFVYFLCGHLLNKWVLSRITPHHSVYRTFFHLLKDRIRSFFLWPLCYILFFIDLVFYKHL